MKTDKITIGILAHVDAGKTTLSESIMFQTGQIDKLGRVDHQDAYLDTHELEKSRGITIFSKQAVLPLDPFEVTLLDTPGHVDFSTEMERTLRVLDYAILVVSGTDGVQGHTRTVWQLLKRYHVPTFIFVNKMDLPGADVQALLEEFQSKISENCLQFDGGQKEEFWEQLALCDEGLMEAFIDKSRIEPSEIQTAIARRHVFPVYFGSALNNKGVIDLLNGLTMYMKPKSYPDIFGARVFKVTRDEQGNRLTYIKVTGGNLRVKTLLTNKHQRNVELEEGQSQNIWQEKVDQVRIYSGASYEAVQSVTPGTVCALTGLSRTKPGDGLGFEHQGDDPSLIPVLSYKVEFEEGTNVYAMLKNLRLLEEEEPHLNVMWNEAIGEIHLQVMGEIQLEILTSTIKERFGVNVTFDKGNLVYRETIKKSVVGVGHFEPLKHYAEVHLLLEPLDLGSGLVIDRDCSEDLMEGHWQRLVQSHLNERRHPGVLTASELTDMKITLVAGRGHKKHTEGGDFRQATFRALRQGLMSTENVLLEPIYSYSLDLPKEMLGRAMADLDRLHGSYEDPVIQGDRAELKGSGPVATLMHYGSDVMAYTKGQGRLSLSLKGYEPCHNQEVMVEAIGYDPVNDVDNPAGSVFCKKGTGYSVAWEEAEGHMHVDSGIRLNQAIKDLQPSEPQIRSSVTYEDDDLEAIFNKTYGAPKESLHARTGRIFDKTPKSPSSYSERSKKRKHQKPEDRYLLVDGYNIVFAWDELKDLAEDNLDGARLRLMDMLSDYQGQTEETVILVFDAYRVAGNRGESSKYHNIHVVYTKEAETADQYIERLVHRIRPDHEVTVATSDVVEQIIILGKGARRLSAEAFKLEIDHAKSSYQEHLTPKSTDTKHRPFNEFLK